MDFHLEPRQVEELQRLLEDALADLSYEIAGTDRRDYRRRLRERRQRLEEIALQLKRADHRVALDARATGHLVS